jgi:uncharacterized protein
MKKVILLHWTWWNSENSWFPYIRNSLDKAKFEVFTPNLPNADNPEYQEQRDFIINNFNLDENTILVWHSAWCPLILSILEKIDLKIEKAILVAWFANQLSEEKEPILQEKYNFEKIKNNSKNFVFINSVNDPWWCDDKQGKYMFDRLWWDLIIREKEGHMWSQKFNQPYLEFPLLKWLIEN